MPLDPGLVDKFLRELAEEPDIEVAINRLGLTKADAKEIFKSLLPKKSPVQRELFTRKASSKTEFLKIFVDGASRGNPGMAGAGALITGPDGEVLKRLKRYLGIATNNQAEYMALITALEAARAIEARKIKVFADSELMVKQITGKYRVRSEELKPLYDRAMGLLAGFEGFSIEHVYREKNCEADRLANEAIDKRGERSAHE